MSRVTHIERHLEVEESGRAHGDGDGGSGGSGGQPDGASEAVEVRAAPVGSAVGEGRVPSKPLSKPFKSSPVPAQGGGELAALSDRLADVEPRLESIEQQLKLYYLQCHRESQQSGPGAAGTTTERWPSKQAVVSQAAKEREAAHAAKVLGARGSAVMVAADSTKSGEEGQGGMSKLVDRVSDIERHLYVVMHTLDVQGQARSSSAATDGGAKEALLAAAHELGVGGNDTQVEGGSPSGGPAPWRAGSRERPNSRGSGFPGSRQKQSASNLRDKPLDEAGARMQELRLTALEKRIHMIASRSGIEGAPPPSATVEDGGTFTVEEQFTKRMNKLEDWLSDVIFSLGSDLARRRQSDMREDASRGRPAQPGAASNREQPDRSSFADDEAPEMEAGTPGALSILSNPGADLDSQWDTRAPSREGHLRSRGSSRGGNYASRQELDAVAKRLTEVMAILGLDATAGSPGARRSSKGADGKDTPKAAMFSDVAGAGLNGTSTDLAFPSLQQSLSLSTDGCSAGGSIANLDANEVGTATEGQEAQEFAEYVDKQVGIESRLKELEEQLEFSIQKDAQPDVALSSVKLIIQDVRFCLQRCELLSQLPEIRLYMKRFQRSLAVNAVIHKRWLGPGTGDKPDNGDGTPFMDMMIDMDGGSLMSPSFQSPAKMGSSKSAPDIRVGSKRSAVKKKPYRTVVDWCKPHTPLHADPVSFKQYGAAHRGNADIGSGRGSGTGIPRGDEHGGSFLPPLR